jgi:outer membrane protein assembly factor BamB
MEKKTTENTGHTGENDKIILFLVVSVFPVVRSRSSILSLLSLCSLCLCGEVLFLSAADWPQFLGPNRNGVSAETGLLETWPEKGPPVLWEKAVGEGYSGPVVAGGKLILFHRVGDEDLVECLDAATGKKVWSFPYPTEYVDRLGKGNGPRSTPLVAANRVFTLGAQGRLHCLELDTGKKIWDRSLQTDYKIPENFFGVGTSPILEGDLLLINVGAPGAGIVAFDKDTGKEVWKATDDEASYSSPVAASIDGTRHVFFFTRDGLVSLDPKTGAVHFRKHWRSRQHASVNAATPIVVKDRVFISASYNTGAVLLRIRKDGADEIWSGDEVMSNHYNTCIYRNGFLYGFDGRQEQTAQLRCVHLETGQVQWTQERFGCACLVLADRNLIALTEKGDLVLIEATHESYQEKARTTFLTYPCRAPLALADSRLYGRDEKKLVCWNVKK